MNNFNRFREISFARPVREYPHGAADRDPAPEPALPPRDSPIDELAALDMDALWEKVYASLPPAETDFNALARRFREQYDAMQAAEAARLKASGKRRRGTSKQPKKPKESKR